MRIYRVSYRDKSGKHLGYDYFTGALVAEAAVKRALNARRQAEVKSYEVPLTRRGILNALTQFASHRDNG